MKEGKGMVVSNSQVDERRREGGKNREGEECAGMAHSVKKDDYFA